MKISASRRRNFSSEGTPDISQLRSGWCLAPKKIPVPQGRRTFSTVPSGRNFLRMVFQPLRGWLISGCRSATQFALAATILLFAADATAETTNALSDAEIQGRALALKILSQRPAENTVNTGVLQIRDGAGIVLKFESFVERSSRFRLPTPTSSFRIGRRFIRPP